VGSINEDRHSPARMGCLAVRIGPIVVVGTSEVFPAILRRAAAIRAYF
jgi:hypothetical protein